MTGYRFHQEAEAEFDAAVVYYESCQKGLGLEFADEVEATIQCIQYSPQTWPILYEGVRRCLTRRFPFGVLYAIEEDAVCILAIMHLHRAPDYWKRRIE